MRSYSPWADASRRHPSVHIDWCDEMAPALGAWVPTERVILLRRDVPRALRDMALAHEVAHVDLEHRPSGFRWFDRRQECEASRLARARMLPADEIGKAMAEYDCDLQLAANDLDVSVGTLRRRCDELTADEQLKISAIITAARPWREG